MNGNRAEEAVCHGDIMERIRELNTQIEASIGARYRQGIVNYPRKRVTAHDKRGRRVRVSLGEPDWSGTFIWGPFGVWLKAVWVGRRRLVIKCHSLWLTGRFARGRDGAFYEVVTDSTEVNKLCYTTGLKLPAFVSERWAKNGTAGNVNRIK
jgi:hypothetical protein